MEGWELWFLSCHFRAFPLGVKLVAEMTIMPSSPFSSSSSLPMFSHASRDASFLLKTRQWSEVPGHPALRRAAVAAGSFARTRARTAAARGLARPRSRGGGVAARSPACVLAAAARRPARSPAPVHAQRQRGDFLARARAAAAWQLARRARAHAATVHRPSCSPALARRRGSSLARTRARALLDSGVLLAATDSGTPGVAGGAAGELEL